METGRASRTAFRVALRRAAHQFLDHPQVLEDPVAIPLLGADFQIDPEREAHPIARSFRAFMAARSRCAEDHLAQAVTAGVAQYVVLGAGLDTFAYRNPYLVLRVFEVDFPATQEWKRTLLANAAIPEPPNLTFVPLDFEHKTLADGLRMPASTSHSQRSSDGLVWSLTSHSTPSAPPSPPSVAFRPVPGSASTTASHPST